MRRERIFFIRHAPAVSLRACLHYAPAARQKASRFYVQRTVTDGIYPCPRARAVLCSANAIMLNQEVITTAETAAIQIPAGNAVILPEGSRIYITQMLGNSVTAASDLGLVRISREEAARAGIIPAEESVQESDANLTLEERVWKVLGNIYDPEIPVDIVGLGLVYGVEVIPQKEGGAQVNVQMTLTAPGCGMGPHIMAEAEMNIAALDGVQNVDVEFVWDPPWNQDMMTEEARMQLGLI